MAINDLRFDSYLDCDLGANILICSHSQELKHIIAALLHNHDLKLSWTDSPAKLLESLRRKQFALIILDITELKDQGTEVAYIIKNEPRIKHIPMILLNSTRPNIDDMIEGCQGCIEYLTLPCNPTVLKQKITNFIQLHSYLTLIKSDQANLNENGLLSSEIIRDKIAVDHGDLYLEINNNLEITNIDGYKELLFTQKHEAVRELDLRKVLIRIKLPKLITKLETCVHQQTRVFCDVQIGAKYYDVRAYPTKWGAALYFRNISKQVSVSQDILELSRLKLLGELAASIAHEIRNPMTTVRALLELASLANRPVPVAKVDTMIKEVDRANKLVTDLLTLSKQPQQKESCCLNDIINDAYPLLAAQATRTNKRVILQLQPCSPKLIYPKEISQLLLNIGLNGLEAMENQGTTLVISTEQVGELQYLRISDEGNGIPEDILNDVWQPFFTTKAKGTGLGLTICKKIVQNNQAEISVNSSNAGTTFTIQFN